MTNPAMKTLKSLLDAIAFANVSNLGELRAMLSQVEENDGPVNTPNSGDALPPSSRTTVLPTIQGAL